ncbi:MAG: AAA family ATPase [Candidatus Nomurabacteria bacterium]|nr:AAA family ATPase [Candidatus Nomurabacteria bacterium]
MHPGIQSWKNLVIYAFNAFSIPLLSKTLFAPWENDTADKDSKLSFIEKFIFSLFSRVLGFVTRVLCIVVGLIFTFIIILTFPIFLLLPIKISLEFLETLPSFGISLSYGETFSLNAHSKEVYTPSGLKLFGKEKVLRMIDRGLSKDKGRNILLVGETGVGKSVVISKLGQLGQSGLSSYGIRNHRVVELNVEGIAINDFEKALAEAEGAGNVIIVIENIHLYTSVFEKLMKYLNSVHLGVIVTTDFSNYDQVLKGHPEFLSKFEKVDVEPTNIEDTLSILKNNIYVNNISISTKENVLEEIVNLSDRFIGNQPQPLKSLLILDELHSLHKKIGIEDVHQVISDKTNMPIGALGVDEKKVLIGLESKMKAKIIGQDEAVKDVSESLRRLRTGIADPSKPAGSFLFLGPTGVGKTYTAKILAESYFGHKNAMIRFDMSEFSLPTSVNTFIERLASVIEENPLSLVFFDELEKSNMAIHHLLLQVLDEGRLTRGTGRVVSFKDSIIIATSNAGSKDIISNQSIEKKVLINNIINAGIFTPEFLNRFSSVILFKPLGQNDVRKVTELMLKEFKDRLFEDKKITLVITDALIEKIAAAGFDQDFGARPIKRAIEEQVENKVADYIIGGGSEGEIKIM